jgi:hypothetical protein
MFYWDTVNNTGAVGHRQSIILVGSGTYLYAKGCVYGSYTTNQSISHLNSVAEPESGAEKAQIYWPPRSGSLLFYQRLEEISSKQDKVAKEFL